MGEKSLVSIIIPCFNHEKYIEETIHSVSQSSYQPIEIIVVNDGSSDNSELVVKSLQKNFPSLTYIYQNNAGPAAARNRGIKEAEGNYILPLDADDLISADYIEKAVAVLDSNPQVKLVYCQAEFFGERQGKWKLPAFKIEKLVLDNMIFCSALYRKTDWQKAGGYDERMTWGWEDWEFWISMLKNGGEVVCLPITGFLYRVRKNSRRKSTDEDAKMKTINLINKKHQEFVYKYLNGPLHYQRSWSKKINWIKHFFRMD
ncbi:MAG: glycosyltransferase family A protein [Bacteroidota bacterium]|nr:glycosyltransferase family A protein [Bacteroidota bacterium]